MPVQWSSNKEIQKIDEGFLLSGFHDSGSIISSELDISKDINIFFDFIALDSFQDNAALLDLDFDSESDRINKNFLFISLAFLKSVNQLVAFARNNDLEFRSRVINIDSAWHKVSLSIKALDTKIQIVGLIDKQFDFSINIPKRSDNLTISFGNNYTSKDYDNKNNSFIIKDIIIDYNDSREKIKEINLQKYILAYCVFCKKEVDGKLRTTKLLDSGKFLHTGECYFCKNEIKRISNAI